MGNSKKKKIMILGTLLIVLLGLSFVIYTVTSANSGDNDFRVSKATMTSIKTGNGSFMNDGLDYSNENAPAYSQVEGFVAGNDSNSTNRIVRSYDMLTYEFNFAISAKDGTATAIDDRKIKVTVTLTEDEAKYVSCSRNEAPGKTTCEYTLDGTDTYSSVDDSITLYVLGAPNGTMINPKFNIKESTDTEEGIYLGNISEGVNYYSYENNSYNSTPGFNNYMPTVVSSKEATASLNILTSTGEHQSAVYEGKVGRYITYIAGIKINGDAAAGIKGLSSPTGSINFDASFTQDGTEAPIVKEEWIRLYAQKNEGVIEPIVVNMPYSTPDSNSKNKEIVAPGKVSVTNKSNNTYGISINDFVATYGYPSVGADNNSIANKDNYISTVAITVFSPRTKADRKRDITVNMNTANGSVSSSTGATLALNNATGSVVNKYYENSDFSVSTAFYDNTGSKIATNKNVAGVNMTNGTGAVSKGTTIKYITKFNYKKTLSDQGLKEVFKIDDNAYRFIPIEDGKDYDIKLSCGGSKCEGISPSDFEVKFVSGSWDSSNYVANDVASINFSDEDDKEMAINQCATVASNLANYDVNQIQNLYGGPCIRANEGVEETFDRITAAKDGDKEIHITKAIIQTKEGVKVPDNISVTVEFNIRVRNVSDITQTYQATVVTSSSDYDSELIYYSPIISLEEDSLCNPNNYKKTQYRGREIIAGDDSTFGDSLRIVSFTSREELTVKNKNSDGSTKTNYDIKDNETITYNVKTIIEDNNETVGADDSWYINSLIVSVKIPNEMEYMKDNDLMQPENVESRADGTYLFYRLPYTKPNMKIPEIEFRARIKPTLHANEDDSPIPITVESSVYAQNINGETDNSIVGALSSKYTIYATGFNSIIVQQEVGKSGTVIEKNGEINYTLKAYNNTGTDVDDYAIIDVFPYSKDENNSIVSGSYSAKVELPDSLSGVTIKCSSQTPANINKEVNNTQNVWNDCDITEEYVDNVTAIKVSNINIPHGQYMGDIKLSLKTKNNNYGDTYNNSFMGETSTHSKNHSNVIKVKVVTRKISGRAFIDVTGNGVKDGNEKYLSGISVTLFSIDNNNNVSSVAEATTDKNGYYEFKNLDKGRYKIGFSFEVDKYDLTLRYATEDTSKDSDAYKVDDNGNAEISNKKIPDDPNGIRLTKEITTAEDMDIGFIPKRGLGFDMKKYITRVDLAYNGSINTTNYDNQSSVTITVRNSLNATAKVYYGISITNTSYKSGYINLIEESIPTGMLFDSSDPANQDWFEVNGVIQSRALEDTVIKPGETKYLQIVLYMPNQEEAGVFLNTASVLQSTMYDPEVLVDDKTESSHDDYKIGDSLTYAGVNWHVINVVNNISREQAIADLGYVDGELTEEQERDVTSYLNRNQILTLMADSGTISENKGHTLTSDETYRWSSSQINGYLNNLWQNTNTLNLPTLYDQVICDDASGLQTASYGGTMASEGTCISGMYTTSKVRLLTLAEYSYLTKSQAAGGAGLSDVSWLNGSRDFWLQNSDYISPEYLQPYINAYGDSIAKKDGSAVYNPVDYGIQQNSVHNKAMYIDRTNKINKTATANTGKEVRPVITVSTHNIVLE